MKIFVLDTKCYAYGRFSILILVLNKIINYKKKSRSSSLCRCLYILIRFLKLYQIHKTFHSLSIKTLSMSNFNFRKDL